MAYKPPEKFRTDPLKLAIGVKRDDEAAIDELLHSWLRQHRIPKKHLEALVTDWLNETEIHLRVKGYSVDEALKARPPGPDRRPKNLRLARMEAEDTEVDD